MSILRLSILLSFVLVGCAGRPTLEELEKQALVTGNWSAVESREHLLLRRKMSAGSQCPTGEIGICTSMYVGDNRCKCVSNPRTHRVRTTT